MTIAYYFLALFLTLIIELSVAYALGFKKRKYLITILFINLITHPLLCYFLWLNSNLSIIPINYVSIIIMEILVVIVESVLLYFTMKQKYLNMLILSLSMNAVSFLIGLLIFKNNF